MNKKRAILTSKLRTAMFRLVMHDDQQYVEEQVGKLLETFYGGVYDIRQSMTNADLDDYTKIDVNMQDIVSGR